MVPAGERSKSVAMLEYLYDELLSFGLTRTDAVVALGGGVVGDLAGFAAATVLRGVAFIQLPTTLLAQVDSSVGGKVAVNLKAGKNLAGAFWQPGLVLADTGCLAPCTTRSSPTAWPRSSNTAGSWTSRCSGLGSAAPSPAVMGRIEVVVTLLRLQSLRSGRDEGNRRPCCSISATLRPRLRAGGHYETYTHGRRWPRHVLAQARFGLGGVAFGAPDLVAALVRAFGLPSFIGCTNGGFHRPIGMVRRAAGTRLPSSCSRNWAVRPVQDEKIRSTALLEELKRKCFHGPAA
jgi:3-dehydroquinate synthase